MLIPIGHEGAAVRRWPLVNVGILVACTALQFRASSIDAKATGAIIEALARRSEVIERVRADHCVREERLCAVPEDVLIEGLRAGRLGDRLSREAFTRADGEVQAAIEQLDSRSMGYIPARGGIGSMFTSMFAHGGWGHLIGNMLFLYVVGIALEERWGRLAFGAFYVAGGLVAAATFGALHRELTTPLVGASGAIAAAMGAFAALFARERIRFFYWIWFRVGTFGAPAWFVLPLWFAEQLWASTDEGGTGVAYSAHAGGFAFGLAVALGARALGFDRKLSEATDRANGDILEVKTSLADAQAALAARDYAEVRRILDAELAGRPASIEAHTLGLELAKLMNDADALATHGAALLRAQAGRPDAARATYLELAERLGPRALEERFVQPALAAAFQLRDRALAQQLLRTLHASAPAHPATPRALWVVAELYADQPEVAGRLRARLVAEYPGDPWAQRARASLDGGPPPRSASGVSASGVSASGVSPASVAEPEVGRTPSAPVIARGVPLEPPAAAWASASAAPWPAPHPAQEGLTLDDEPAQPQRASPAPASPNAFGLTIDDLG